VSGVWAVLAAAGSGERLGADRPKAFARLGERVLLAESLERLDASDWVDALGCAKVSSCVTGGATRAESVRAALVEVAEDAAAIVVHDAARPLVTETVIGRVLAPLSQGWDAAVPALALPDTLKRVDGVAVVETLDRTELVAVQTPQAFVASVLRDAFTGDVAEASDCASLVERRGGRVCVVEGDPRLVKVTSRADLDLVASWL
jgi:2-C-methyl-D-erythritol 4-phosphate cytidylyltransferase